MIVILTVLKLGTFFSYASWEWPDSKCFFGPDNFGEFSLILH